MKGQIGIGDLIGLLAMDLRREAVTSLLAGNDTCCFTTEQYKIAYDKAKSSPKRLAKTVPTTWTDDLARMHLESTGLVKEVEPGIWRAGQLDSMFNR